MIRSWQLHPWQALLTYRGLRRRQHDGRMVGRRRTAWLLARSAPYQTLKVRAVDRASRVVKMDGPCPMLTCTQQGPHEHGVCAECGAVRYGNLFCPTCLRNRHREEARP